MVTAGTYYNENDPQAVAWLRELINAGHIPAGEIDTRSITEVEPNDLYGFTQHHFFAGIGGWPLALRLAGWPDDAPVGTGSCPCQPFSTAGKQAGSDDIRHLWPVLGNLILEWQPAIFFGEQVSSPLGREWLAGVFADLEDMGYSRAGADLCAAGVGAPHIRQRLYWLARRIDARLEGFARHGDRGREPGRLAAQAAGPVAEGCGVGGMAYRGGGGRSGRAGEIGEANGRRQFANRSDDRGMGNAGNLRRDPRNAGDGGRQEGAGSPHRAVLARPSRPWDSFDILHCTDGKARRIEPGTFPLAHGVPARVGRLRGYGNAIVPQLAATFIQAAVAAIQETLTTDQQYEQAA